MIVVGMGFGDEGKGLTTTFLCSRLTKPIVVRFNGGHQAGHTVYRDGTPHVFSNFGSATQIGVPTVWSHYCTFYPIAFYNEWLSLQQYTPKVFVHALAPVTTPLDVYNNRLNVNNLAHGSCGVGFGATIKRQESFFKLFAQDLFYPNVLHEKLQLIADYYGQKDFNFTPFIDTIDLIKNKIKIIHNYSLLDAYEPVFEGAQGIMLDQDHGFFPHVTHSNTTSKNALSIYASREIYYVTRSYQTRHGNGPLSNETRPPKLLHSHHETNISHPHQGEFRRGILDLDLLGYAITSDLNYSYDLIKNLVITCVDQTGEQIHASLNGNIISISIRDIPSVLPVQFKHVFVSKGPDLNSFEMLL